MRFRSRLLRWGFGLLFTGCGGSLIDEPGSSGQGTGGTGATVGHTGGTAGPGGAGGTSSSGGMGAGCGLGAESAPPFSVTLVFANTSSIPLWLWLECLPDFELTSCGDGYSTPLGMSPGCMTDCSVSTGCIVCGPCLSQSQLVSPGGYYTYVWEAQTYTYSTNLSGCSCYYAHDVPAGWYRVSVPVWIADPGMLRTAPTFTTVRDFPVYRAGDIIEIELMQPI